MIHYHGTPFSGKRDGMVFSLQRRHAMVSFAQPECLATVAEVCQSFTIDNGAFSTWKSGKEYDIEGYADFISKWYKHPGFDWYIIPDSIDGDLADNHRLRAQWGNLVNGDIWRLGVPVWHLHEPLEELQYLTVAYDRIAFGSSGDYSEVGSKKWWARMTEAMKVVCCADGHPKCKLHGLRMLDPTIFSHFPFSSADSTNVARNIGIDSAWHGTYQPVSRETRAHIMIERIEQHAAASRWCDTRGVKQNLELFG